MIICLLEVAFVVVWELVQPYSSTPAVPYLTNTVRLLQ